MIGWGTAQTLWMVSHGAPVPQRRASECQRQEMSDMGRGQLLSQAAM